MCFNHQLRVVQCLCKDLRSWELRQDAWEGDAGCCVAASLKQISVPAEEEHCDSRKLSAFCPNIDQVMWGRFAACKEPALPAQSLLESCAGGRHPVLGRAHSSPCLALGMRLGASPPRCMSPAGGAGCAC